jgi:hypothetical protein
MFKLPKNFRFLCSLLLGFKIQRFPKLNCFIIYLLATWINTRNSYRGRADYKKSNIGKLSSTGAGIKVV